MNRPTFFALSVLSVCVLVRTYSPAADLAKSFREPPISAWPWVYWFPLDGNITSNGITADLEAIKRAGIGGVLYMETDQGAPKGPAPFGGPLWRRLFQHLCLEADRLGLQVNMNNDAGWCGSGGPWITPELSMQRLVWTETNVTGPLRFEGVLAEPKKTQDYYTDIAVFAYPTPPEDFRIPRLSGKSAETREEIPLRTTYPPPSPGTVVSRGALVNLTWKLGQGGRFSWEVPAGHWTLLRLGHTTTGKDNHPAPLEGRGLECDKLSKGAAEVHFANLMGKLIADNKALVGEKRTLVSTHIDSWEVGSQNWTPKFRQEFRRLRGYDPLPLLPVATGRVVDSFEISERFLWDMRQTVNDLLCENYAGHFRTLAHRNGIRLSIEAYDTPPCDDLTFAGRADEPMAEFWSWSPYGCAYSCTEMSSAAHVYGRRILGAEAFTATDQEKWQGHPGNIKSLGDWAFCEGINRFVFHRYALQPWTEPDRAPGMSMGPWGLHYERGQTWWDMSRAWHDYLARCQYLLQQGLFVADLCFLAPETSPQRFKSPVKSGYDRPGYNFDACPPEVVLERMTVRNGRLVLPDGMSYRMLVLPQVETMTPELLSRIRDLVRAGATVLGAPPKKSPSLQNYPKCDEQVHSLARELWGDPPLRAESGRRFGRGRVIWPEGFEVKVDAEYSPARRLGEAKWIWHNEGSPAQSAPPEKRLFRRFVDVDGEVESAILELTADNSFECWVNGRPAGKGDNFHRGYATNVLALLRPGTNLVAVAAVNETASPNPAGWIGTLEIKYRDGRSRVVNTDAGWESAKKAADDWNSTGSSGSDIAWSRALELGPMGMQPWGELDHNAGGVDAIPDLVIPSRLLAEMGVVPDFRASARIRYIHKRIGADDLYFLSNPEPRAVDAVCTFRVRGRQPELWEPDTGITERAADYEIEGECTSLPIRFDPSGSVFVLFREKARKRRADGTGVARNWLEFETEQRISGPWQVKFDRNWGGPADTVTFDQLGDWSKHPDAGIRHYSGKAVYSARFQVPSRPPGRTFLNLGQVAIMAQVSLNGGDLGVLWKAPFRVEVTDRLKSGENALEVTVVNLWINRMIGDEQLPEDSARNASGNLKSWPEWLAEGKPSPTGRFTFTSWRLWKKDDPLVESGLLGPVNLERAKNP